MIKVTVLWEDKAGSHRFGPHELLVACIADELEWQTRSVDKRLQPVPQGGSGRLKTKLRTELRQLQKPGPVFAVLDRDKMRLLWSPKDGVNDCMTGHKGQLRKEAPGDYDIVFLDKNMESLLRACPGQGERVANKKPNPNERDILLYKVASGTKATRDEVRKNCPSFDRLVRKVAAKLRDPI